MDKFVEIAKAVMIGHAIGDALGVPVEFCERADLVKNPITDMQGYGSFKVPKGTWSDDTSMALCALQSFTNGMVDFNAIMNNFCRWCYNQEFTATGVTFDVGITTNEAIYRYYQQGISYDQCGLTDRNNNGNGSLMRIHPFVLYFLYQKYNNEHLAYIDFIGQASALTHAHPRSRLACVIFAYILAALIEKPNKTSVLESLCVLEEVYHHCYDLGLHTDEYNELPHFQRLFDGIEKLNRDEIKSDSYVVHTLEAAVWCLLTTNSYEDCVLTAVNLGSDTDTTAAVAGALAGALYSYGAIPKQWRDTLLKRDAIESLCEKVFVYNNLG